MLLPGKIRPNLHVNIRNASTEVKNIPTYYDTSSHSEIQAMNYGLNKDQNCTASPFSYFSETASLLR